MIDSNGLPERFLFLRHGETDYNRAGIVQGQLDVPLNDNGRGQAAQAAELFGRYEVSRIVASDLSRVMETVTLVNARMGVEVDSDPRLRERYFGPYQDKPRTKDFWTLPEDPEIEPMEVFVARIMAALADHKDTRMPLFVSHGGFLRACAAALPVSLLPQHYANAVPMEFTRAGGRWTCTMVNAIEAAFPA